MRDLEDIYCEQTWTTGIDVYSIRANDAMLKAAIDVLETPTENTLYVAKNGSDVTGNGSIGLPFLTIGHANDVAIAMLNPVVDFDEAVVIKVAPGKYTEHLTTSHRRVYIVGADYDLENWGHSVIIYNTGADASHYPIGVDEGLNLIGLSVKVDVGGVFGKIINKLICSVCVFEGGYFITNSDSTDRITAYFNHCLFEGNGFKFEGTCDRDIFIALRYCDIYGGTSTFGSTSTGYQRIKFEKTKIGNSVPVSGNWDTHLIWGELYGVGRITFDTDGYVELFSSIIRNGIHFYSDTPESKKVVNCIFKDSPTGEGDITADVSVEFIEYSGNHQDNGIDGKIITVSKIKNVAGGQNKYRNIHEALEGSVLTDTIINLEGDVEISEPLVVNPNIGVQIDGNKKWKLTTTHATTLADLGANQHLSFVNMTRILGGKKVIVNGNNAALSFVDCGRYTEPNYVNIEITAGNTESYCHVLNSSIIGTGAPAMKVSDVDVWIVIDNAFMKGASGQAAILWTLQTTNHTKMKYTTFLHGSGGSNDPLIWGDTGNKVVLSMYNCALNKALHASFSNNISNPNITVDPQIDY